MYGTVQTQMPAGSSTSHISVSERPPSTGVTVHAMKTVPLFRQLFHSDRYFFLVQPDYQILLCHDWRRHVDEALAI